MFTEKSEGLSSLYTLEILYSFPSDVRTEKPEEPPAESEQETAPARGQRAQQEQSDEEDVVSDDDERIENSVHIGLRAIEKIIGGKVIDERPLHQI